ncbi:hypothetical protein GCM10027072_80090 [Streptomyces bullii]
MVRDAAQMEVTVEAITSHLLASHNLQASGVRGQPLSALVRKCRDVARQVPRVDAEQLDSLDKLLDRVVAVAELRNTYVHGGWAQDFDGSYLAVRGKRGQSELVSHSVSGEQLLEMIKEIRSISDGLLEWVSRDLNLMYGRADDERVRSPSSTGRAHSVSASQI